MLHRKDPESQHELLGWTTESENDKDYELCQKHSLVTTHNTYNTLNFSRLFNSQKNIESDQNIFFLMIFSTYPWDQWTFHESCYSSHFDLIAKYLNPLEKYLVNLSHARHATRVIQITSLHLYDITFFLNYQQPKS